MKALPELGGMDLSDVENSKMIMDTFLLKVSFSMSTSILGIVLSVSLTLLNTFFSAEKQFVSTIENFTESFNTLWSISSNNNLPKDKLHLEEDEDPLLVLAEDVVAKELNVKPGFVKLTRPIQGWWLQQRNPKESEGVSKDGTAKFRLNSDASHQPPQNEAPEKEEDTVPQSREDLLASKEVPELKKPVETEKPKEETAPTESVSHEHPELEADSEEETDKESAA
ncbi:MAG: hypothetical protein CME60_04950 [Halobacteriovoraceae bacterium]|nr:hypothetical protein [Halobacteriovoraceae bacterium]